MPNFVLLIEKHSEDRYAATARDLITESSLQHQAPTYQEALAGLINELWATKPFRTQAINILAISYREYDSEKNLFFSRPLPRPDEKNVHITARR